MKAVRVMHDPPFSQDLHILPRAAMPGEFVPGHYFRRLGVAEIRRPGRPLEMDLGCGDGLFLAAMARRHPERDFLGVERLLGRVRKVSRKIRDGGLVNARVLRLESRYVVEWMLPPEVLRRCHLLCPDPWPKGRHQRRRLVDRRFLDALWLVLEWGGEFRFLTDHEGYFDVVADEVSAHAGYAAHGSDGEDGVFPDTDFQRQWQAAGRTMHELRVRKVSAG
jgi:tRNA (guanine-N7-)-methyltransferase